MTFASLAGPPSLLAWRRICAGLDALAGAALDAGVAEVEALCAGWPDDVRRAPGRWLRALLDGEKQPRLRVARAIDLTLHEVEVTGDRLAWIDEPALARAAIVRVFDDRFGDEGVARWCRSTNYKSVRELALAAGIRDRGAALLASDPRLAGLHSLALFRNAIGPAGLAALLAAPLPRLRRLLLGRNALGEAGARVLAGATITGLELLDLDCDRLDGAAIAALVAAPLLATTKTLNLSNNPIGADGCAALARARLDGLRVLYLHGCGLDDAAVAALLRAPWLAGLDNLALSDNRLSMATVERLAGATALRLGELDICHNRGIDEAEAEPVLRAAPQLAGLRRLCL